MKTLTIISGKGGTGKTSITAAFAALSSNAVLADCDVDAADLYLILDPTVEKKENFIGSAMPEFDMNKCIHCGLCYQNCRFDAITEDIMLIEDRCEGCGVCEHVCPADAITMKDRVTGESYISTTRFGPMAHAKLHTAQEASGKLVTLVRNNARLLAMDKGRDVVIVDGPPGTGCPVISAISGVDLVLIVTEPTLSGIHDLKKVLSVAQHFHVKSVVAVNKYNINSENTAVIEDYCRKAGLEMVGKIPYDTEFTRALINRKSIVEYAPDSTPAQAVKGLWSRIMEILEE